MFAIVTGGSLFLKLTTLMNIHKNNDVHNVKTQCEPVLLRTFESRYNELLQAGKSQLLAMPPKSFGYDELRRMINRLDKFKDNYIKYNGRLINEL